MLYFKQFSSFILHLMLLCKLAIQNTVAFRNLESSESAMFLTSKMHLASLIYTRKSNFFLILYHNKSLIYSFFNPQNHPLRSLKIISIYKNTYSMIDSHYFISHSYNFAESQVEKQTKCKTIMIKIEGIWPNSNRTINNDLKWPKLIYNDVIV